MLMEIPQLKEFVQVTDAETEELRVASACSWIDDWTCVFGSRGWARAGRQGHINEWHYQAGDYNGVTQWRVRRCCSDFAVIEKARRGWQGFCQYDRKSAFWDIKKDVQALSCRSMPELSSQSEAGVRGGIGLGWAVMGLFCHHCSSEK